MNQNRRRKIVTNPRKLPQQERSKITVDAILTATARILVKDGYAKTTTNRIAELAGVSIGSLYQYFPNKEAIVAVLIERHVVEIVNSIETKTELCLDKSLEHVLHELVKVCIQPSSIELQLSKILIEQLSHIELLELLEKYEKRIRYVIRNYLEKKYDKIHTQNLDLTALILEKTVKSLTHAAIIENPEFLIDGQLEREITNLWLRYLKCNMTI